MAAALMAGSGKEAHTKGDDAPVFKGCRGVFRVVTSESNALVPAMMAQRKWRRRV